MVWFYRRFYLNKNLNLWWSLWQLKQWYGYYMFEDYWGARVVIEKKKKRKILVYFPLDLMKIHIETSRKAKPAMPLTSLAESNIPSGLNVVNTASPNKITANIKTRNTITASSVFMDKSHPLN
jgi:hypothetical protein